MRMIFELGKTKNPAKVITGSEVGDNAKS